MINNNHISIDLTNSLLYSLLNFFFGRLKIYHFLFISVINKCSVLLIMQIQRVILLYLVNNILQKISLKGNDNKYILYYEINFSGGNYQ